MCPVAVGVNERRGLAFALNEKLTRPGGGGHGIGRDKLVPTSLSGCVRFEPALRTHAAAHVDDRRDDLRRSPWKAVVPKLGTEFCSPVTWQFPCNNFFIETYYLLFLFLHTVSQK